MAGIKTERAQDFISYCATTAVLQPSAFDLTVMSSTFDTKPDGSMIIEQKCSVTIPWGQVKLALVALQATVVAHELEAGQKIKVRENTWPTVPAEPPPDATDMVKRYHDELSKLVSDFIADQKQP